MTISPLFTRLRPFACALLVATLAFGASACTSETEEATQSTEEAVEESVGEMQNQAEDMAAQAGSQLTGTISALQNGITSMGVDQAVSNIDGWAATMEGNAELSGIHDNLMSLKSELQADEIDGAAVGELLTELGDQTTQAASSASGQMASQIERLGGLLTQAGNQLSGN